MPIYYYRCKDCQHQFDFLHIKSDDVAQCPICDNKDLEKLPTTHVTEIFNFRNIPV